MPTSLKVLHSYKVYRPDLDGGIPSAIATLSRAAADGFQNHVLVARYRGLSKRYRIDDVPVEAVTSLGTFFSTPLAPAYPFVLLHHAKSCDIVVYHAPFPLADLALFRVPANVAVIVYWHADIVGYKFLRKLVARAILRTLQRADRIIVADRSTIENSSLLPSFADKISVVPYGTDVDFWSTCTEEEQTTAKALRSRYPRMILAIGRLVAYKGFDVLLHALKEVDGHAVLIGEGPQRPRLQRLAEELGVSNRIVFAGRLSASDIKAHLHAAQVLAFPSVTIAEAFGIVQLEAMAAGLPVVNTVLSTAVPHIARHDKEGLTVLPGDPAALAVALTRILDEPALADRLGKAGQIRARTEYSREKYDLRIKDIYRSAVETKRP